MRSLTMTLADGRTLSWAVIGAEGGRVVVANHGAGSSRLETAYHEVALRELGVCVIAPERPGYGGSGPVAHGPSVRERVADIAELVNALDLDSFAVYGYSRGALDALAVAASSELAPRVSRVVLSAPGAQRQPPRDERERAIRAQVAESTWPEFAAWIAEHPGPDLPPMAPADEEAFAAPRYLEASLATLAEGRVQGAIGVAGDAWSAAHPAAFDLAAVEQPVDIFHGTADTVVPITHGRALAAGLPRVALHERDGEGHFSIGRYLPEFMGLCV